MPRSLWVLLLAFVLPVAADELTAEKLRLARTAMEAKIKVGDALLQTGDVAGAIRAYEEAINLFRAAVEKTDTVVEAPAISPTESVSLGLKWLAAHQDESGTWDCDDFMKHDPAGGKCDGAGSAQHDVGVTALALLAFLGAGSTDSTGDWAANVNSGLAWLKSVQDAEGCFGTRASQHFIYNHAFATLAMCEAYGLTKSPRYLESARSGVRFLERARNPYLGWRYVPRDGDNDTSVTGICTLALKSAKAAGLDVDPAAFEGARAWVDRMTDPELGRVGYNTRGGPVARMQGLQDRFPPDRSEAMTALGILVRIVGGEDPQSPIIRKGAELCVRRVPKWDDQGSVDMYYWYYGTLAMFQVGGDAWRAWHTALGSAVAPHQRRDGSFAGSWDPVDPWGPVGGRVYSTALMTLCMEVHARYDRASGAR